MPETDMHTEINEPDTSSDQPSPCSAEEQDTATPAATTRLVKIKFRPAGRQYDFAVGGISLTKGDRVVVETDRGRALGTVASFPRDVENKDLPEGLKPVMRHAGTDDLSMAANFNAKEEFSLRFCRERIAERNLAMKLVRAEYLFDGSKIIFYFTADGRIDFRELVKDLAHHFHTRIEMRQIGVRDEAKLIGGMGICGRELCCSSYLTEFVPVSVKMAKEQELALNPNKISGQCGRLLCCLAYEYETYCDMKKGLPKCGRKVTVDGREGEVISQHILRQTVTVNFGPQQRIEMTTEEVEKGVLRPRPGFTAPPPPPERQERSPGQAPSPRSPERQNRDNRQENQRQRPAANPPEPKEPSAQPGARPQGERRPQGLHRRNRGTPAPAPEAKAAVKIPQQQIKQVTAPDEGKSASEQEVRRRRQRNRRRSNRKPGTPTTNDSGE